MSYFNTSAAAAKTRLSCVGMCRTPDCCPVLPFQIARRTWWPTARSWSWPPWNVPGYDAFRFQAPGEAYDSKLAVGSSWPAKGEGTWCWARLGRSWSVAASLTDWPEDDERTRRRPLISYFRLGYRYHRLQSTPSRLRYPGEGSFASALYARHAEPSIWSTPLAADPAGTADCSVSLLGRPTDPSRSLDVLQVRPDACSCVTLSRTLCSASISKIVKCS